LPSVPDRAPALPTEESKASTAAFRLSAPDPVPPPAFTFPPSPAEVAEARGGSDAQQRQAGGVRDTCPEADRIQSHPIRCPVAFHVEVDHVQTGDEAAGDVHRGTEGVTIASGPRAGDQGAAIQAVLWYPGPTVSETLTGIVGGPLELQIRGAGVGARQVECLAEHEEGQSSPVRPGRVVGNPLRRPRKPPRNRSGCDETSGRER